jgi:hypothetical protein
MTAPTLDSLRDTLDGLQRRQARLLLARQLGFALVAACAVIAASLVLVANFASSAAAVLLVAIVSTTLIFSICSVAWRQSHRAQADQKALALYVEEKFPDLEQRLLTSIEFSQSGKKSSQAGVSPAFVEQLINDARSHVDLQRQQVERVGSSRESVIALVAGFSACLALVLLLQEFAQLRQAAQRLVWPFALEETVDVTSTAMPISLLVEPGDIEMQRGSPLTVTVRVENAQPGALTLRLQDDRLNWRDYPMLLDSSDSNGATFSYYLPAVVKDSNYLISLAGEEQSSRQYQINLYDLPEIEQIDVAMDFPDYTGEEDRIEFDGGDIVAAEGTEITLTVTFNKPVARAEIQFSGAESETDREYINGSLDVDGLQATTRFTVASDGVYRITAADLQGLQSESPLDYYIRAIEDQPPQFTLRRPGADRDVMPLEEVVIEVDASDDYGLGEFILNYAVVGEEDKEVDFLPAESVRSAQGSTLLYLEDLAVEPGDFISYYLTLADNNALKGPSEVVSDIYFLEVIPTDQEFRRSQQQGGGGGGGGQGGGESSALVSVQKDIIAATWKLRNRLRDASSTDIEADAEIIAESQREATGRAKMSIDRLSERLSFSDDSYDLAVENLSLAIEQMNLAANDLDSLQITTALKPEQLALQYVLKAEANINRTDISMNQNSGGGGGGGAQQEREDLRELFEMEMGQLENRYETPNSASQAGGTNAEEVNKLEELARRQEALTRAQRALARREQELAEEQRRRELERLRRQQEQLSADVEKLARELAQNGQGQQSQPRNSDSPQQGQQNQQRQLAGQGQQSTQQTGAEQSGDPSAQAAIERALEQMQQAAASDSAAIAAAQGQKALESLRDQQRELSEAGESSVSQIARRLGERGQALVRNQQALQEGLAEASRNQGLGQTRREARRDEALQTLLEAQRQQQRDIEEIEDMLRAVVTRGESEDRSLLTQAQAATRDLKPIRDEMATSNRVLRNGMLNLAIDMEQELGEQIQQLAQSLAQLNPSQTQDSASSTRQVAGDAQQLRQQIESLSQQAAEFNQRGETADDGNAPSLAQMREQLESSQALADSLSQQLAQQRGGSAQALRGDSNTVGTARSIRQQLSRQDIEAFLAQPELLKALLQPIVELEGALRAQAELESAATQLYSADDETIPDAYRELVEQYYRTLSEGDSGGVR